ncbi:hypothetical protein BH10PSE19_BH10PSE19_04630 [soil metagenome]
MLDIRTFRSERKGIRVDLYRRYKLSDPSTGKAKFTYKQVGSFPLAQGYSSELLEILQPDEILQLKNWLAETALGEQFNTGADELVKFTVRMPQTVYDALMHLYIEAKRVNIEFIPNQVMLDSLLHKAKLVQHKLDKINGFNSGILEKIGINTEQIISKENKQELIDIESRVLFKTLLELKQPLSKTCTELEQAAKLIGKEQRIPPPKLQEWAGAMPSHNQNRLIKKWCYAIAIDVLQQHGIDPLTLIPPEKVAMYWAIQQQQRYTLEEAQKKFTQTFNVPNEMVATVKDTIKTVYQRLASV